MKLKATIIVILKGFLVSWKQVVLVYVIFPLLLATCMGYFQKDIYKPEASREKIRITLNDRDNTEFSKGFVNIFNEVQLKELFEVVDKGDYVITIPSGYMDKVTSFKEVDITVDEKNRVSRTNELIIREVVKQYGKSISQSNLVRDRISKINGVEKEKLYNEVMLKLNNLNSQRVINNNLIKGNRVLNSYENQAASFINFMLMMMVMSCAMGHFLDLENGSFKRLISTPIKKITMFNLDIAGFFVVCVLYSLIYVLGMRIAGYAFIGANILSIGAIIIGQSLVAATLAGLIIAFLKKKYANVVMILLLYFQIFFGGAFMPIKELSNKVLSLIANYSPGNVVTSAYRKVILLGSFSEIMSSLLIMLATAAVIYIISIIKVRIRWEE